MNFEILLASVILPSLVGVVLLFIEHRTGWFASRARQETTEQALDTVNMTRLDLNILRIKWIAGTMFITALVVSAVLSLGYLIMIDYLESVVEGYEQAEEWQLPEAIANLRDAGEQLTLSLQERETLSDLEQRVPELESAKVKAETEAGQLREANSALALQVKSLEDQLLAPEQIELAASEALPLVGNSYYVGLQSVYDSYVTLTWRDNTKFVHIGQGLGFSWNEKSCEFTLVRTFAGANKAEFALTCTP